ncbi:MAG: YkgJ family cysteine cluster protein [Promethearchaeota archaeon]
MANDKFWEVVKKFNLLMKSAIEGPNCLDVCNGNCCSIRINVPKVLAKEYIKRDFADKKDFIRSDVFSFKLRFDEDKGKCFLFDKKIKGCSVHNSGIKPPQCWIYPTNFSNPEQKDISCKKTSGWKIVNSEKAKEAEELLQYYIFLCKFEAKKEAKAIINRLNDTSCVNKLRNLLKQTPPSRLAGVTDTWDCISVLYAQGISLQLKKVCQKLNKECNYIMNNNFLECPSICDQISNKLIDFLHQILGKYIENNIDSEGEYPLIKLFEFDKIEKKKFQ